MRFEWSTYSKYKGMHESFNYKKKNKDNGMILDYTTLYNLIIINNHFKMKDEHLITIIIVK